MRRIGASIAPMNTDTWLIYLLASIGLSLSPGPNGLLALTHMNRSEINLPAAVR